MPRKSQTRSGLDCSAATILAQLGGSGRLTAMIGMRYAVDTGDGLKVRFTGRARRQVNCLLVTLEPADTYQIDFWAIRGFAPRLVETVRGVQVSELRSTVESTTGLSLSL